MIMTRRKHLPFRSRQAELAVDHAAALHGVGTKAEVVQSMM